MRSAEDGEAILQQNILRCPVKLCPHSKLCRRLFR